MSDEVVIESLSDYINKIKKISSEFEENDVLVYRGENQEYLTPCLPNLFRQNRTKENHYFEKNLLDEMVANKLTDGESYLIKAVDAQHGGFPSRLLDVTYDCLVALYFAITPSYKKRDDIDDDKNGVVYVFDFENMYCPIATNVKELYDGILERKEEWLFKDTLFQYNHKFVDHVLANNRIIAQKGAVILFQGDGFLPIPKYGFEKIIIPSYLKSTLRVDLKKLFGIYTGFIYPEGDNKVDEIVNKSIKFNPAPFSRKTEIELISHHIKKYIGYNIEQIISHKEIGSFQLQSQVIEVEKELKEIKDRILKLNHLNSDEKEVVDKLKSNFNIQIDEFEQAMQCIDANLIIDIDFLKF
ncbi:FRG domain-containing protein [[Clostridium] innocuum]|nr:FRG domain-containing protein [[Clostridium] innocuum]